MSKVKVIERSALAHIESVKAIKVEDYMLLEITTSNKNVYYQQLNDRSAELINNVGKTIPVKIVLNKGKKWIVPIIDKYTRL
jgi:hypothetical protein